ncbi:MAG: HipA domain-containing protein [Lachnospiraceae bacterium]|nr:HipA domain-containing protein [Lachnospiraceae bacterium]
MKDYSAYPVNTDVFLAGAEQKCEIQIDGFRYIMKYQKNSEIGLLYNHISEYLGSHVFALLDIPVQETFLGTYQGQNVVLMKHFCLPGERLVPFNDVGESTLEQDKELYQYSYEDIEQMLRDNTKSVNTIETVQRFWDMFIVDALNGNFDRHGGNWGFIRKENHYRIAPVYDNGSCMYPRLNTDRALSEVLNSAEEIERRIYSFPTSHIKLDGRKSSYYDIIHSLRFPSCNDALKRIVPRIDLAKLHTLIDFIDGISDTRKRFYKTLYEERYRKILLTSYQKLTDTSH